MRGRRLLCKKPLPRAPSRRTDGLGDSGGEAASLREAPLPQTPSPEEQLGIDWSALLKVRTHESWARVPAVWLWSRRLTEPPRPASARNERYVLLLLYPPAARMRKQPMASRHGLFSIRRPPRRMSAAALSAAVDSHKLLGDAPTPQAEPTPQKHPPQTPAALRERGVWGERRFSQRSGLSPQNPPVSSPTASSEGSAREGASLQRSPLPRKTHPIALVHACACGGGHFFPDGRLGLG